MRMLDVARAKGVNPGTIGDPPSGIAVFNDVIAAITPVLVAPCPSHAYPFVSLQSFTVYASAEELQEMDAHKTCGPELLWKNC